MKQIVVTDIEKVPDTQLKEGLREKVIFNKQTPTERITLIHVTIEPGKSCGAHRHSVEEVFVFVAGQGTGKVGDEEMEILPGRVVYVPAESIHNFTCTGDEALVMIATLPSIEFETTWLEK